MVRIEDCKLIGKTQGNSEVYEMKVIKKKFFMESSKIVRVRRDTIGDWSWEDTGILLSVGEVKALTTALRVMGFKADTLRN